MSSIDRRPDAARGIVGTRSLLRRLLDDESLLAGVRELEAPALAQLVRHVGLEDAGELLALASREQLEGVLDHDLWRSEAAGQDEAFDAARFGLWLEVMLDVGADAGADRLAELDEDLVVHGLSQLLLVLDSDELTLQHWGQDEDVLSDSALLDKALESSLSFELDRYLLVARTHDGWDALIALLTSLDARHPAISARLLERCCDVSRAQVDDSGGLFQVLSEAETLAEDVADARDQRRAGEGFVAPASARALLALAQQEPIGDDVITRGYFQRLRREAQPRASSVESARLLALLRGAEERERAPSRPRLRDSNEPPPSTLRDCLEQLRAVDAACFERRSAELAFVANVLLAGSHKDGRAYRPVEAAEDALALCDRGLRELIVDPGDETDALEVLKARSLVTLFGIGWRSARGRAAP